MAVWGHYHGGNLGDELVVETIVDAVRRRLPGASIVGISMSPADTRERHGIDAYPINPQPPAGSSTAPAARPSGAAAAGSASRLRQLVRRVPGARRARSVPARLRAILREPAFLLRSQRLLRGIDLVVVAGSGQLLDEWRGPWLHPYTTFRWAMLARLTRTPVHYLSVGAGPVEERLSCLFLRAAVAPAAYVSVRDGHSAGVLSSIGIRRPLPVCPDIGYGLPDELLRSEGAPTHPGGTVVGLNVMAHQDPRYWPRGEARRYDAYLRKMTAFTRWLLDYGYTVRLFTSQPRSDGRVADDLLRGLAEGGELDPQRLHSAIAEIDEVRDLVRVIAGCDRIVAARYHSLLLPLLLDIPVLGLAYNPKTTELFAGVALPERCLDIDAFTVDSLVEAFGDLGRADESEERQRLRARVAEHRASVAEQFDELFGTPDGNAGAGRKEAAA